jgi:transketolase
MTIGISEQTALQMLQDKATRLRIDSVRSTTEAGSGHPTSCASAAEIMSVLFYSVMRYDPRDPHRRDSDVFVLSKGHAAPILYAAWAEAGAFPRERLLTLRRVDSDLEGHPTPRLPFVDVATGSLGQGLSVAAGIVINAKQFENSDQRVYVLLGDGESAEGSVWEAAQWAALHHLNNLCATIDINRLGQSQPTMLEWDLEIYKARWEAFGWQALIVDGHSIPDLLAAYETANRSTDRPTIVLARTLKGKGLIGIEGLEHWHGKALPKDTAAKVISELEKHLTAAETAWKPKLPLARPDSSKGTTGSASGSAGKPPYVIGGKEVSPRRGFGDSLAALAKLDPSIVVLDGDVKNSTYTEEFESAAPTRFLQGYIAEQNIVGVAMGLAARGKVPVAALFACFITRAYDFIRMAAISKLNIKFVGTHCGVSIGEDGPSQMGLEDLAMMCAEPDFTVLYPADATSAWKATALMVAQSGLCYLRLGRPDSRILYSPDEEFAIGKCKVLRKSDKDSVLIIAGGITVFEALAAYEQLRQDGISVRVIDLFSIQPIDRNELIASARAAGGLIVTVEDHYEHGGLGDAVLSALAEEPVRVHKLAVREIAHSGKPKELIEKFGISSGHIVSAVKSALLAAPCATTSVARPKKGLRKISLDPAMVDKNLKPMRQLHDLGQSLWLDNISRGLLTNGTLRRYIDELSVTGLTSNPTIFDHAIKNSNFYDNAIHQKMKQGKMGEPLFFELALEDLRQAADLFRPIYDRTNGTDGWVSMEVSPLFAHDTARTVAQAKQLYASAGRPNLFIKIPGTAEGVPAIEEAIFSGVPVNVTLLFSSEQYLAAADAYLRGVERRIEAGLTPDVRSVASVFISRWDKATMGKVGKDLQDHLGIAVAKRTYKAYRQLLDSERWQRLANAGARPQRLLWASTGTKDPAASDVLYIKALAAPFTINTIPDATLLAFADHGKLGELLPVDGGDAETTIAKFGKAGIDYDHLAADLQREGTESFIKSWNELLSSVASKNVMLKATG